MMHLLKSWLLSAYWRVRAWMAGIPTIAGATDVVELNVTTVTELDSAIPELWTPGLRADAERMTFWGPNFEGQEGSGKPIIRRDDFTKSPGDTIHVQVFRPPARAGVTGNTTLSGTEEQLALGQFDLTADWVRHAVAFNKRATRRAVFDAARVSERALAKWMAKTIDDDMFERLIITETAQTTLFAGNVASAASLGSSNVFTPDEIDRAKLQLMSLGALPFDVAMDNGVIIYVLPTIQVSHYKWGSFLRPEARLNGSHTAAVTTITVGGSDTSVDYTEYFPQSGTNNVLIDDEVISFTGNTNSTLTGATRPATGSGTTAATHADGAMVALASSSVERERAIAFGSEMAVRTWAVLPTNQNELQDYRFKFGIGIEAAYGQRAVVDARSNVPNYVLLNVAAPRP